MKDGGTNYIRKEKVVDQEFVNVIFAITITIYESQWFKEKERTRDEVQEWVAEKLAEFDVYTIPMGMSWGALVSEGFYKEHKEKEKYDKIKT